MDYVDNAYSGYGPFPVEETDCVKMFTRRTRYRCPDVFGVRFKVRSKVVVRIVGDAFVHRVPGSSCCLPYKYAPYPRLYVSTTREVHLETRPRDFGSVFVRMHDTDAYFRVVRFRFRLLCCDAESRDPVLQRTVSGRLLVNRLG